jgi:hypothetical protein
MDYAPIARIIVRYIVGLIIGADAAGVMAADPDVITMGAIAIGGLVEVLYALAKKKEWKL